MRKILLVDDNLEITSTFAELLTHDGYECMEVDDGWPAITAAATFEPDVILMDLDMPGLDGYSAARVIRTQERRQNCWIVALSGRLDIPSIGEENEPFDAHLSKPISYLALKLFIQELPQHRLEASQPSQSANE